MHAHSAEITHRSPKLHRHYDVLRPAVPGIWSVLPPFNLQNLPLPICHIANSKYYPMPNGLLGLFDDRVVS